MRDELDLADLRELDNDEYDVALLAREGALPVQEGHAAADFHDAIRNLLRAIRDDQHGLAAVETRNDLVGDHRIHVHADQREHRGGHAEQEGRHAHDHAVEGEDDATHVERVVLLGDGADDIEAARAAVHAEDNAVADAVEDTAEDGCEHDVIDRRVGIEEAREIEAQREDARADDDIDRVAVPERLPGCHEKRDVVEEGLQADGQLRQVVDDDRDARRAARQEMGRHEEEVDGAARDQAAHGDAEIAQQAMAHHLEVNHGRTSLRTGGSAFPSAEVSISFSAKRGSSSPSSASSSSARFSASSSVSGREVMRIDVR